MTVAELTKSLPGGESYVTHSCGDGKTAVLIWDADGNFFSRAHFQGDVSDEQVQAVIDIGKAAREKFAELNPHETPAQRRKRIEAFKPWAARGFVVGCA
jgi:hypothetical protein